MATNNDDILASLMESEMESFMDGAKNEVSGGGADAAAKDDSPSTETVKESTGLGGEVGQESSEVEAGAGNPEQPVLSTDDGSADVRPTEIVSTDSTDIEKPSTDEGEAEAGGDSPSEVSPLDDELELAEGSTVETASPTTEGELPPEDKTEAKALPSEESDVEREGEQPETFAGAAWLLSGLRLNRLQETKKGYVDMPVDTALHPKYGEVLLLHGHIGFSTGTPRPALGNIAVARDFLDGSFFYLARTNCIFGAAIPVIRSEELDKWFDSLDLNF